MYVYFKVTPYKHIIISENKKYGFQKGHPSLFISKWLFNCHVVWIILLIYV